MGGWVAKAGEVDRLAKRGGVDGLTKRSGWLGREGGGDRVGLKVD